MPATPRPSLSRLANLGAQTIYDGFRSYERRFAAVTQRAPQRFQTSDWKGLQTDAAERLALYSDVVRTVVAELDDLLDEHRTEKLMWASMKAVYSGLIAGLDTWELAETFFNSITRRIFTTVGVDQQIEFVDTDFTMPPTTSADPVYRTYQDHAVTAALVRQLLADQFAAGHFADLERDVERAVDFLEHVLQERGALRTIERAEVVEHAFIRGQGAYLVGRLYSGSQLIPLALCLLQSEDGITLDAVLVEEDAISILFSFTRSYFHVQVDRPYDLVRFLRTILPRKRIGELYISLGYNKHGKTELYRDLVHHLHVTDDQFVEARGKRGMVMMVFTMPSYDLVFKVIKDYFAPQKEMSRADVMERYDLVFRHDRAGRLVDTQTFEHLAFERRLFSDELLEELRREAPSTVRVEDDQVVVAHAYVQRRVLPLDLFVHEAGEEAAQAAAYDYGCAIKDLARSNIFPGDMLLKNFGVTRHGRVVFYDYDEISLITDCNFRPIPKAESYEQALASEPWYSIGPDDVFPQEFRHFLRLPGALNEVFVKAHEDLYELGFWTDIQERLKAGSLRHLPPYPSEKKLPPAS